MIFDIYRAVRHAAEAFGHVRFDHLRNQIARARENAFRKDINPDRDLLVDF